MNKSFCVLQYFMADHEQIARSLLYSLKPNWLAVVKSVNKKAVMNLEESEQMPIACPPTKVNQWVEQQLAAIRAEAEQLVTDPKNLSA